MFSTALWPSGSVIAERNGGTCPKRRRFRHLDDRLQVPQRPLRRFGHRRPVIDLVGREFSGNTLQSGRGHLAETNDTLAILREREPPKQATCLDPPSLQPKH